MTASESAYLSARIIACISLLILLVAFLSPAVLGETMSDMMYGWEAYFQTAKVYFSSDIHVDPDRLLLGHLGAISPHTNYLVVITGIVIVFANFGLRVLRWLWVTTIVSLVISLVWLFIVAMENKTNTDATMILSTGYYLWITSYLTMVIAVHFQIRKVQPSQNE